MNIRWNLILAVITLGLLAWFYTLHQDDEKLTDLIKPPEKPEYIGQKMETVVFSPTGEKQYVALSDKVEHFTFDGHTDFTKPVVYVLDVPINKDDTESAVKNQIESWKLTEQKFHL